jgi:hypothetical protein
VVAEDHIPEERREIASNSRPLGDPGPQNNDDDFEIRASKSGRQKKSGQSAQWINRCKRKAVNLLNGLTASNSPANSPCHKSVTSCESQVSAVINAGLPTKKGVNRIG